MNSNGFEKLTGFLNQLEQTKVHYTLAHHRDEAVMVAIAIPGERWEIEFFQDGSVEVERFVSNGAIVGDEAFKELFARYTRTEDPELVGSSY